MRLSIHPAPCSGCRGERDRIGQRYCKACHAKYMRENRPKHRDLATPARLKANARSYANVYQKRGLLVQQPCETCGDPNAEKHHEDYTKPIDVRWLCRECHLAEHRGELVKRETFTECKQHLVTT